MINCPQIRSLPATKISFEHKSSPVNKDRDYIGLTTLHHTNTVVFLDIGTIAKPGTVIR
ncbi:hypothetical protein Vi05172_g11062 [Venturia inaequalis]|nr:hypothetical protein Vi05172_g11062 [Venturia inaequalis]